MTYLEHVNITVSDPDLSAQQLVDLLGWKIRWSGAAMNGGYSVHVGSDTHYIALYTNTSLGTKCGDANHAGHMNHVGVVVKDLNKICSRAKELDLEPFNFGRYEADEGKRFYLKILDDLEIEVTSYQE